MADTYFVIHNSDGDTYVHEYTKEQLLKFLNEDWKGVSPEHMPKFANAIPDDGDTAYWGSRYVIIKGQIVTPEVKQKVVEYDIV